MLKFKKMAPQKSSQQRPAPKRTMPQYREYPPRPPAGAPEVVNPIWLLKAIGITLVAALVCGYGSLCFLLYQGQWQLILHPHRSTTVPATIGDTPISFLRFGTDESGTPQLTGWSIPATPGAPYAGITVLFLPSGDGEMASSIPTLTSLHALGVNLFAIDYRGYGQSVPIHPNQARMTQDAAWAFQYLTTSRAIPEAQIVPYGTGVGASLAAHLAADHPAIPAIVLDSPGPDPLATVLDDPRTKFLPVHWLLHDRFPLAEPLTTLKTPKLLLLPTKDAQRFSGTAAPKMTVYDQSSQQYGQALTRFLDQYLHTSAVQQLPLPATTSP
jgi:pimeloyl-ACP methyl ester carboxylesterase